MKIDELPESIILKDEHFKIYLNTIIETVRNEIWKENLIKHYTKHGIDHSERIAQYLGKLLEGFPALLNQQERFVLLAAIFLHDIGNQLPRYAGIPIKSTYSTEELEKIRESHHLSSCQAVKDSIKTNAELPLGLDLCKEYSDFIALLCKYHRKLDLSDLKDTSIAGDPLRLHLLGAFLRLGDELDADYRRVDMEVLNIIDIPTESKFYWWSHYYVQSISIDQGHIKLFFRFPEEYKNNNLVEVFQTKRKESLREQFLEVYDIFENYGVRLYRDIEMGEPSYLSAGSLKLVPPDLLEYIKIIITQTGSNYKELSFKTGVAWEIDGVLYSDDEKAVKALAKISQLMNKFQNKEAVKVIEDTRLLTMSPKDRMIFSGIAGNCYLSLCDFEKAKSYYKDLLKLSEREDLRNIYWPGTILARSVSLGNMGVVYKNQGKLEKALEHHQQALKIHREIGNKKEEANNLGNMGVVNKLQGKLKEALEHHQQALEINRRIGNKKEEASNLGNMGVVYKIQGKLKEALEHHQQALKIDRRIGNKAGVASAFGNMGNVYQLQSKLKEALEHHQQALEIDREIGNKAGVASALGNMGIDCQLQSKLKEALEHHQQALKINREIGNKVGVVSNLGNMGIVFGIQNKPKKALLHFQKALEIDREIGNKAGVANLLYNIGIFYRTQGKPEKALSKFQEALEIFDTLGSSRNIEKMIKIIKIVEEEVKNKVVDDIMQNNQEKSKIKENTKKSKIFLSYSHRDKKFADRVDKFFISRNIRLTRDVRDIPSYSSIKKFMDTIRNHDYVILLISDAYLKSINCMYEVIQFIQEKKYIEKTFPIIIDKQVDIFNRVKHIDYINFWQKKYECFRDEINKLKNTGTAQSHVELDKMDKIQSGIGEFLDKIADLKCFPLEDLENTGYKDILNKINDCLKKSSIDYNKVIKSKNNISFDKANYLKFNEKELEKKLFEIFKQRNSFIETRFLKNIFAQIFSTLKEERKNFSDKSLLIENLNKFFIPYLDRIFIIWKISNDYHAFDFAERMIDFLHKLYVDVFIELDFDKLKGLFDVFWIQSKIIFIVYCMGAYSILQDKSEFAKLLINRTNLFIEDDPRYDFAKNLSWFFYAIGKLSDNKWLIKNSLCHTVLEFLENNNTVLDVFSGIEKLSDKLCQFDYFQCINEVIVKVILGEEKYYDTVCFPSFGGFYMKRTEPFIEEIIKSYDQGKWIPKISKDQLISVIESLYDYSEKRFNKNPLEISCWAKGGWKSKVIKDFMEND